MALVRRAGRIILRVNGELLDAKGDFTYNIGGIQREFIIGADRVHGFKETIQLASIEGNITDRSDLDIAGIKDLQDTTVELVLANGKSVIFRNAAFTGEGNQTTEDAEFEIGFGALSAEEQFSS